MECHLERMKFLRVLSHLLCKHYKLTSLQAVWRELSTDDPSVYPLNGGCAIHAACFTLNINYMSQLKSMPLRFRRLNLYNDQNDRRRVVL